MNTNKHILILGAGPAGLAAAYYAQKAGLSFQVIEQADSKGGNARTIKIGDHRFDTGAHRVHDKIDHVTDDIKSILGTDLHEVSKPSKIRNGNTFLSFPLSASDLLKNLPLRKTLGYTFSYLFRRRIKQHSFRSHAVANYGSQLANDFLLNYTEKLWGAPTETLSPDISGNRISGFSIWQLFKKKGTHLEGKFYYPSLGIGQLFEKMAEDFEDKIHLNSRVTSIDRLSEKYHVQTGTETFKGTHIINTLPLNIMPQLLPDLKELKNITFQDLNLLFVSLRTEEVTPYASLYFPDQSYPFSRIVEPKNRSLKMAPTGETSLCVELPKDVKPDLVISKLEELNLITKDQVIDSKYFKLPNAYPRLTLNAVPEINSTIASLEKLPNFVLLGRNATFRYLHIHQLMDQAKHIIDSLN